MKVLEHLRHYFGLSLSSHLRRWEKEFENETYYRAVTDRVYSYVVPLPDGRGYGVDFRILCNHPLKAHYLEDGRTRVFRRSFRCREQAERFQVAEMKRAAHYFPCSDFFAVRGSGQVQQCW
ncbi:hypothetical protein V9K67_15820 [Paraflavisolibacter sp. H34]|uniref:hypothetical protein n=1 Tax=Huijunlia imazamoxiresistens TaxID=3127457 RepID=UPI003018930F